MNKPDFKIKFMYWYKGMGRIVYFLLLLICLVFTAIMVFRRMPYHLLLILIDFAMILGALMLEITLTHYSQLGTKYVEAGRKVDRYTLALQNDRNMSYYVNNSADGYVIKLEGQTYLKTYRKENAALKEDANIDIPYAEITTIERVSRAADNNYSIFSVIGENNKVEEVKIVVQNKYKNIRNYVS